MLRSRLPEVALCLAVSLLVALFLKLLRALPLSGTVKPELLAVGGAGLGTTGSLTTILPSPGSFNSAATSTPDLHEAAEWLRDFFKRGGRSFKRDDLPYE